MRRQRSTPGIRSGPTGERLTALAAALGAMTLVAAPAAAHPDGEHLLVFTKTTGFRHDSIPDGIAAITDLGAVNGFTVEATEDAAAFTDANLSRFDAVVWLSTTGDDNSGVFVGFPDPGTDPWVAVDNGYEVQIDPTDAPERTTGAIYSFQSADVAARDAALKPPGEWNAYEIVVSGQRIRVFLNGVLVNDFTSTDPARDPSSGHIGLQNHGDGDDVWFRNVRIKELSR